MSAAGKEKMFQTWMAEESDLIQAAAKAYGHRLIAEKFQTILAEADDDLKPILNSIFTLYLTSNIEERSSEMLLNKVITPEQSSEIRQISSVLCAELGPQSLAVCDAFGITDTMLSAPIAMDWVSYNTYDNQGELRH